MKFFVTILLCGFMSALQAQKFEGLAMTPPMGWNSWNKFACDVDEKKIKEIADALVSSGMKDAGYTYVVIDDCWQVGRDSLGNIIPDPDRFPSGIKALGDYIHSKGLKFGIYSCAGTQTCQRRPGSRGYEFQDARTYASWGVDYLKYDWCFTGSQDAESSYTIMRDAIYKAGRPMIFSICEWGYSKPWLWAKNVGHLWRTTDDIVDCWNCVDARNNAGFTVLLDRVANLGEYSGPDHWNDPDMLEVGNSHLSLAESRAHFSLWCMLAAPLMAGNDVRNMTKEVKEILTNKELIAVDQDSLGKSAKKIEDSGDFEVWVKELSNSNFAICFFNRGTSAYKMNYNVKNMLAKHFNIDDEYTMRDLWLHKRLGTTFKAINTEIPSHDVLMLLLNK